MTTVIQTNRVFIFKGIKLNDPNPRMRPEEVRTHFLGLYPDMLNTQISIENKNGKEEVTFKPKVGGHG